MYVPGRDPPGSWIYGRRAEGYKIKMPGFLNKALNVAKMIPGVGSAISAGQALIKGDMAGVLNAGMSMTPMGRMAALAGGAGLLGAGAMAAKSMMGGGGGGGGGGAPVGGAPDGGMMGAPMGGMMGAPMGGMMGAPVGGMMGAPMGGSSGMGGVMLSGGGSNIQGAPGMMGAAGMPGMPGMPGAPGAPGGMGGPGGGSYSPISFAPSPIKINIQLSGKDMAASSGVFEEDIGGPPGMTNNTMTATPRPGDEAGGDEAGDDEEEGGGIMGMLGKKAKPEDDDETADSGKKGKKGKKDKKDKKPAKSSKPAKSRGGGKRRYTEEFSTGGIIPQIEESDVPLITFAIIAILISLN